jgi:hypothetical protein
MKPSLDKELTKVIIDKKKNKGLVDINIIVSRRC